MTTRETLDLLRGYESRNVTFLDPAGGWPVVWQRAKGVHVWDAEGKKYLDLTAAFGVAAAGHANPRVVRAGQKQMSRLLHAMGDVHPHPLKALLAGELSRLTFERWSGDNSGIQLHRAANKQETKLKAQNSNIRKETPRLVTGKTIFCNSGFEAVEAALKTAMLATGRPGIIAFEGGYHGLGYGALQATHRPHFRSRFTLQLAEFGNFVPFPSEASSPGCEQTLSADANAFRKIEAAIRQLFRSRKIGAILVEPIQVRGGINIPPTGFVPLLRRLCNEHGALLVLDEIYTGFGRTGKWFACEHTQTVPDVICLGKALTGGFPLSACVGRAELMDAAWPNSKGEAIHTSTFLGHPVGCAMALAQIKEIEREKLIERSARLGDVLLDALEALARNALRLRISARGLGLLAGLDLQRNNAAPATQPALAAIKTMLHRGYILLPEGEHANFISFTPPLIISENQIKSAVTSLGKVLSRMGFARQ
jgi:4-aminobutyrate aminotransferase-like enzyme